MDWLSLVALAIALAMDAFAVAIVTGLTLDPMTKRQVFRLSFHFGLFQGLMPLLGWLAGSAIYEHISAIDHWLAFGLLAFVGSRMLWGTLHRDQEPAPVTRDPTSGWSLVLLSVATSIDALAVGLSLALVGSTIVIPALVIGIVAAGFTVIGMVLGRRLGALWGQRVELLGGLLLIGIGLEILLDHLST